MVISRETLHVSPNAISIRRQSSEVKARFEGIPLWHDPADRDPVLVVQPSGEILFGVGVRNYLVEGVSATGKTSVCRELNRRGYQAINGDRELAYQGDPETGEATASADHEHHIWDVDLVRSMVADQEERATFFCGGSRNFSKFLDLFDEVFVLDIDVDTLRQRLDERPQDEWGSKPPERDLIVRLHRSKEDIPSDGLVIDATRPLSDVVDGLLRAAGLADTVGGEE